MALFTRLMVNQIQKTFGTDINLSFEIVSPFKFAKLLMKHNDDKNNDLIIIPEEGHKISPTIITHNTNKSIISIKILNGQKKPYIIIAPNPYNDAYITVYSLDPIELDNSTKNCGLFQSIEFKQIDFENIDTSNVTDMHDMFFKCTSELIHLDSFNTTKVTNMRSMFSYCTSPTLDLSSFDTTNCTDMELMFDHCSAKIIHL